MPLESKSILKSKPKNFRISPNKLGAIPSTSNQAISNRRPLDHKSKEDKPVLKVKFDLKNVLEYDISPRIFRSVDVQSVMEANAKLLALRSPDIQDEVLVKWLDQLSQNVATFNKKNYQLLDILLELKWMEKSDNVVHSYCDLMLNLMTAFTNHTRAVLKMILKNFTPEIFKNNEKPNLSQLKFEKLHNLLQSILKLIPSTSMQLPSLLSDCFPYMKKSSFYHQCYVYNLLEITKYAPTLRKSILELIMTKMINLDSHCSKADIEDVELSDEEDEKEKSDTIFKMETDDTIAEKTFEMKHPLARNLDCVLNDLFEYIDSVCWRDVANKCDLNWEDTKKLYKEFLTIFDSFVLPTHACAHVQFVMFYICSFRHHLFEGFIDYLWKKVQNPNIASILRQVSVCYLGSFICRAAYVNIQIVKDCLNLMNNWLHSYINNITGSSKNIPSIGFHGPFYSVSQIVFYVVAFRHKELIESTDGLSFLQSLNLDRLVTCSLNPLKMCLTSVVTNFASVARNYQFAYCYTIIEKNNRMGIPVAIEVSSLSAGISNFEALETFFPFDPYLLKNSGTKITPLYRVYSGALETEDEDIEEDEDDFIQDVSGSTPTSPNILMDVLSYGSSPGFKFPPKTR